MPTPFLPADDSLSLLAAASTMVAGLGLLVLLSVPVLTGCEQSAAEDQDSVQIAAYVKEHYPNCSAPVLCGDLAYVDCGSAVDGPSYYLEKKTGKRISACGGACWIPQGEQVEVCKTLCPPKQWTCRQNE